MKESEKIYQIKVIGYDKNNNEIKKAVCIN